jgi:3-hydroxyisobutyrate dehydrogenase
MGQRVAFIGLGNMGGGMAARLVEAGFEVRAFDSSGDALKRAEVAGCSAVASLPAAADGADFVVSMLPNGKIVEAVYIDGDDALLAHLPAGALVIDCSTVSAENSRRLAAAAAERGIRAIDAPVSGGVAAATAGTLSFMCGGSPDDCEAAGPLLAAMGANVFRAGTSGAGQLAKICNNMLLAVQMAGTAEAIQLGVDNGLDAAVLSEIMRKSSGGNWVLEKYNPYPGVMPAAPASRDYRGGFMVDLMLKDLGLAMATAAAENSTVPMGDAAHKLYQQHRDADDAENGALDFSSIQRMFSEKKK